MVYLLRYKCSELSVINNTGLQYIIYFPHSCCLQFFLHFTLQNWKESAHKEQKANCTDLKLLCFPTVMLFSKLVSFFSLHASDYITATPALPDGKTLSLNCHGLFGHEGETLALGGGSLDSRAEMQDIPQVVFRLRSVHMES